MIIDIRDQGRDREAEADALNERINKMYSSLWFAGVEVEYDKVDDRLYVKVMRNEYGTEASWCRIINLLGASGLPGAMSGDRAWISNFAPGERHLLPWLREHGAELLRLGKAHMNSGSRRCWRI